MWSCDQSLLTLAFPLFKGWYWFRLNSLGLALGMALKSYTSVGKGSKLKSGGFWGLIPTFVEAAGEKLVGDLFVPPYPE